jgi:hypothetical protein
MQAQTWGKVAGGRNFKNQWLCKTNNQILAGIWPDTADRSKLVPLAFHWKCTYSLISRRQRAAFPGIGYQVRIELLLDLEQAHFMYRCIKLVDNIK